MAGTTARTAIRRIDVHQGARAGPGEDGLPLERNTFSVPHDARPPTTPTAKPPSRWWRRLAPVLVVIVVATAGWMAYRARVAHRGTGYVTVAASVGPVVKTVTSSGTINPVLTIIIGSYVSGVIQSISCDFNTQVKKGQVCAKIDPRPYQTVVDADAALLADAKAQRVKDLAALAYARATYARDVSLAPSGYVSRDTLDAAHAAYDASAAQVELDRAAIASREATLRAAQVNLGYTDIVSPVNGTVVSRNVAIGQTVAASFQTPTLFLIATDMTRMQVDTNVSETDIGAIREGQKASFHVESYPERSFDATVVQVRQAPQTIQNVVTYDVVLGVENQELLLKPGMTATVKIVTDARSNVLRVPDQALRYMPSALPSAASPPAAPRRPGERSVWTLVDGRPVSVPIVSGLDDDSYTEVRGGDLKPGQPVIVGEQAGTGQAAQAAPSAVPRFTH